MCFWKEEAALKRNLNRMDNGKANQISSLRSDPADLQRSPLETLLRWCGSRCLYSPFQHTDVLMRDETFNSSHFPSPPVTGGLAVEDDELAHLEGELRRRPGHVVEHGHSLQLCVHTHTHTHGQPRKFGSDYPNMLTIHVRERTFVPNGSCIF